MLFCLAVLDTYVRCGMRDAGCGMGGRGLRVEVMGGGEGGGDWFGLVLFGMVLFWSCFVLFWEEGKEGKKEGRKEGRREGGRV